MKNEYRRFRKKILLRAFAVFVLASAVWYGVFSLAAQSVPGTMIAEAAVQMLVCVKGMTYKDAEELFKSMVADNKLCLGLLGCVVSAAALFVITANRMAAYLSNISSALDQVEHEPEEPVVLPEELLPPGVEEPPEEELPPVPVESVVPERKEPETIPVRPSFVCVLPSYSWERNWNT